MDQEIVRVSLVRLDNTNVTMSERLMPEPEAFEVFALLAKELTGREITKRPLEVRPAGSPPLVVAPRRWPFVLIGIVSFLAVIMGSVSFFDYTYHQGWQAGYVKGIADFKSAYGTR